MYTVTIHSAIGWWEDEECSFDEMGEALIYALLIADEVEYEYRNGWCCYEDTFMVTVMDEEFGCLIWKMDF